MVANSGVGSMPSSASRSASGTTSAARNPSSCWLSRRPIPLGPRRSFQGGGDLAVQGPQVQRRGPAVGRPRRPVWAGRSGQVHDLPAIGRVAAEGPGRLPQVEEGLAVLQPFALHQPNPGLVEQVAGGQGELELVGHPAAALGGVATSPA